MNISDLAAEIVDLVQTDISNKISTAKTRRQVASKLSEIVNNFKDATEEGAYVVVVNLNLGSPESVCTNHPGLQNATFICTDNIAVADDEENAVVVQDDVIVIGTGEVYMQDDMTHIVKSAHRFERQNY